MLLFTYLNNLPAHFKHATVIIAGALYLAIWNNFGLALAIA